MARGVPCSVVECSNNLEICVYGDLRAFRCLLDKYIQISRTAQLNSQVLPAICHRRVRAGPLRIYDAAILLDRFDLNIVGREKSQKIGLHRVLAGLENLRV